MGVDRGRSVDFMEMERDQPRVPDSGARTCSRMNLRASTNIAWL